MRVHDPQPRAGATSRVVGRRIDEGDGLPNLQSCRQLVPGVRLSVAGEEHRRLPGGCDVYPEMLRFFAVETESTRARRKEEARFVHCAVMGGP